MHEDYRSLSIPFDQLCFMASIESTRIVLRAARPSQHHNYTWKITNDLEISARIVRTLNLNSYKIINFIYFSKNELNFYLLLNKFLLAFLLRGSEEFFELRHVHYRWWSSLRLRLLWFRRRFCFRSNFARRRLHLSPAAKAKERTQREREKWIETQIIWDKEFKYISPTWNSNLKQNLTFEFWNLR